MNVSLEFALVQNLHNAAIYHKEHCDKECYVSLNQMKEAAKYIWRARLIVGAHQIEIDQINTMFENWPF